MCLQLIAAPFVAGALFFKPPFAFMSLIPGYIFGEYLAFAMFNAISAINNVVNF